MNQAEMWLSTGTLLIETGMWYLALKSLKQTEESIRDTNDQNAVTNQRDRWKVALVAYRKLFHISNRYSIKLTTCNNKSDIFQIELMFFSYVITWSKEYLLYSRLADPIFIKRCAGPQLKIIYKTYRSKLKNLPGCLNDIILLKKALNSCDILKSR